MKAKFVNEQNFERGRDPKSVMGIGIQKQILEFIKDVYRWGSPDKYHFGDVKGVFEVLETLMDELVNSYRHPHEDALHFTKWVLDNYPYEDFINSKKIGKRVLSENDNRIAKALMEYPDEEIFKKVFLTRLPTMKMTLTGLSAGEKSDFLETLKHLILDLI